MTGGNLARSDIATPLELYVLSNDRSVVFIRRFLDYYLPQRAPTSEDYPIPENADTPAQILSKDTELLAYMEANRSEPYGVYWGNPTPAAPLQTAMVFYTRDGAAILGLAGYFKNAKVDLQEFARFAHGQYGWLTSEERPPDTAAEFIAQCHSRDPSTRITA